MLPSPRRLAPLLLVALAGCSEEGPTPAPPEAAAPRTRYTDCADPASPPAAPERAAVCEAWREGRDLGEARGAADAARLVERATADGYRLRRLTGVSLAGLTLLGLGALLGARLRTRSARRRRRSYAEHALDRVRAEAAAIRALGEEGDPLVRHLVDRIEEPLADLERRARDLAERCEARQAAADGATGRAHVSGLRDRLDAVLARVERLHVQATVWEERLGSDGDEALEGTIAEALDDLRRALDEVAS